MNGSDKCEGVITRSLLVDGKLETSVIDFVIISEDLFSYVDKMIVDEDRKFSVARIRKEKGETVTTESDHNPLITEFNMSWKENENIKRIEMFNFRNSEGQRKFKDLTKGPS